MILPWLPSSIFGVLTRTGPGLAHGVEADVRDPQYRAFMRAARAKVEGPQIETTCRTTERGRTAGQEHVLAGHRNRRSVVCLRRAGPCVRNGRSRPQVIAKLPFAWECK